MRRIWCQFVMQFISPWLFSLLAFTPSQIDIISVSQSFLLIPFSHQVKNAILSVIEFLTTDHFWVTLDSLLQSNLSWNEHQTHCVFSVYNSRAFWGFSEQSSWDPTVTGYPFYTAEIDEIAAIHSILIRLMKALDLVL